MRDAQTGNTTFLRSVGDTVEHLPHFEGMFWKPDALNGQGAFAGTWIDEEIGARRFVPTSGSTDLEMSRLEARLRLGGILMKEDGIEALWNPEWRNLEQALATAARMEREGEGMSKQKPLEMARADLDKSLVGWVQAKNSLEKENAWPGGHQGPADIPRRIDEAASEIHLSTRRLANALPEVAMDGQVLGQVAQARESIKHASVALGAAVEHGTEHTLEQSVHPQVFASWQGVCGGVESFARSGAQELSVLQKQYPGVADYDLGYAAGSLETAANVALESRKRGIRMSLNGPLAEFALEDAGRLGLSRKPDPREQGILRGRLPDVAIVESTDGAFVACPVPPGRYTETGKAITLHDRGDGIYTDRAPERKVLPEPDQDRVLGSEARPGVVTRWTGLVLGREEDGSALYVRAADKVTKLVPENPQQRFPDIPAGSYGVLRMGAQGVQFEEGRFGKQRGLQRG
jgi:hypothetical protein